MYSTGEYFPDRTLVHKHTTYVPNPAGTIIHESRARTPSTAVVYDTAIPSATRTSATTTAHPAGGADWEHARAGRKKRLSPEELREIHDLGYARGVDIYQESPIDEFALSRPKGMHGRMRKVSGKTKKVLGTVMGNPYRQAVGEEQAAMGEAEVEAAREYKRHQRDLLRAHDMAIGAYGRSDPHYAATAPLVTEPGYAGQTADFATDRTIAYSEFPRRGIEHHAYEPVQAGYPATAPTTRAAQGGQTEVVYQEETYVEERRVDDGDLTLPASRRRHRRHGGDRRDRRDRSVSDEEGYYGGAGSGGGRRQRPTQVYL